MSNKSNLAQLTFSKIDKYNRYSMAKEEYVGYVRRSREEDEKQKASIPQQIEACYNYARKHEVLFKKRTKDFNIDEKTLKEIRIAYESDPKKEKEIRSFYIEHAILSERGTAKEAGKRTVWAELMELIKGGLVTHLFGYAPDRFSRNMIEGGYLMHLVDNKLVKLRFSNFTFEENSSGHMMLGIFFVFAEHYSKKLSEDSVRSNIQKTLIGDPQGVNKWGYHRKENKFVPHPVNFPIVRKAFERKLLQNWSDEKIANEINKSGWAGPPVSHSKISNRSLWTDTFYYGRWERNFKDRDESIVCVFDNLEGYNFMPIISVEEFIKLQELRSATDSKSNEQRKSRKHAKYDKVEPFPKRMLIYEPNGSTMGFNLPNPSRFNKKLEKLKKTNVNAEFYEVVPAKNIEYRPNGIKRESVKVDVIFEAIQNYLQCFKLTNYHFEAFKEQVDEFNTNALNRMRNEVKALNLTISKLQKQETAYRIKSGHGVTLTGKDKEDYNSKVKEFDDRIGMLQAKRQSVEENTKNSQLEMAALLNLLYHLPQKWREANYVRKKKICEILFSNIFIKDRKVHDIKVKEELQSLFSEKFRVGTPARNRT